MIISVIFCFKNPILDYKNLLTEHRFFSDAQQLFGKEHPRISSLIGYVTDNRGPPMAVFPWCEGKLDLIQ